MAEEEVREKGLDEVFCSSCGAVIKKEAEICPKCGVRQRCGSSSMNDAERKWLTLVLFSFFLGGFGVDRFYVGKVGTGIAKLITLGGCGIWWLIDFIMIVTGNFTDSNGNIIKNNA